MILAAILSRLRRAVGASIGALGPQRFRAGGEVVVCPVCGGGEFVRSSGGGYVKPLLLEANVPWLKLTGHSTTLLCTHCTHILTFGRTPELLEETEWADVERSGELPAERKGNA